MQNIVVIWDQLGQEPLRFFVTQNQRFLDMDRMYINTYTDDEDEKARLGELCALMYDDDGNCKQTIVTYSPRLQPARSLQEIMRAAADLV